MKCQVTKKNKEKKLDLSATVLLSDLRVKLYDWWH